MGYTIPGWLDQVLDYIGIHFPNVDEDDYRHMATAMREFADKFEGHGADAHKAVEQILASSKGWAVHSMQTHWNQVKAGHLDKIPELARLFADALDVVADIVFGMKTKAEAELAVMAGSVGLSVGLAFVTGGLSAVLGAAEVTAMRQLVKRIIDEAADQIVNELIAKVTEPVNAKLEAMIEDAVLNLAEDAFTLPPAPTGTGGDGGADAGHGHGGMKLASAGGGGGMELASASGGGAGGDLHIDHEEFESGAGKLSFHGSELHANSAAPLGRAKGLFGRTRGKDPFTQTFDSMIHGALHGCERALVKVGKHITETVPDRARGISRLHKGNDIEIGHRVKGIETDHHGDGNTPVYLLNHNGTVERLHSDGRTPTKIDGTEPDLPDLVRGGKVWRYRSSVDKGDNPYALKPDDANPKVQSRRLGPDEESDLAYATQLARYSKKDYAGGNYAAAHYVDSNGNKFILVGHSKGVHSERTIGYPVLRDGNPDGLSPLYTERQPCQAASSWCDQWLAEHFKHDMDITHSHKYDQTPGPDGKPDPNKDAEHKAYRQNLRDWHEKYGLSRGMMTEADGAAMEAARQAK
ncbi:nucleic acid/nucleotide deaminase domain-containing protein [Streptomyces sp. NPDC050743]|uniref:nucleic acid/nucleotide deaminase domain-containing protein n=1 Tax=Streptomyces sp. NPDC050743 TaxID=3365634 RepID=UPI0037A65397